MKNKKCLILLFVCLLIELGISAQEVDKRISITFKNESLSTALKKIGKISGVRVEFAYEDVNPYHVTANLKNVTAEQAVKTVIEGKSLTYSNKGRFIVVSKVAKVNNTQKKDRQSSKNNIVGQVLDNDGSPLIGVTVRVKGTNNGGLTDLEGQFTIPVDGNHATLIFSYVGKKDLERVFNAGRSLKITLEDAVNQLNDVVVTGYQTISKERATGAYNIIKKDALEKPTTNIASRLVGVAAGVQATIDANGNPKFEIRGLSSLGSNASPLVVVDGFAIDGSFNSINPNDVENVTILKDAAAASIWGARSANGVIVVTTKSGNKANKGKIMAQYSNFFKFAPKQDLNYTQPYASVSDIIDFDLMTFNKAWGYLPTPDSPQSASGSNYPSREDISEHYYGYLSDAELEAKLNRYKTMNNRSQVKKYILQNPFTQQHDLSLTYNTDKLNVYSSVMYQCRDKQLKGNSDDKIMINLKTGFKLNKILTFNTGANFVYQKDKSNGSFPGLHPYQMLVDESGNRLDIPNGFYMPNMKRYIPMDKFPYKNWGYNPISERENTDNSSRNISTRFLAGITANVLEGLSLTGNMQYETTNEYNRNYSNEESFKVRSTVNRGTYWDGKETFKPNYPKGGILDQNRYEFERLAFRGTINFNREFNEKHSIALVAGTEVVGSVGKGVTEPTVYGYDDNRLTVGSFPNGLGSYTNSSLYIYNWMGSKIYIPQQYYFSNSADRFFSAYANANYTYDGKYSFSGSIRTDASNLITDDPKYRYSPFWSLGASWQLGKEAFLKGISWIDQLTLRATYGYNGNVDRSTSFKPLINVTPTDNPMTSEPSATVSSYGNPTLRWERTGTFNFGVNYSLFNGKLFGSIDYYNKQGKDLMSFISIPAVSGTDSQKLNTAEMLNKGVELEIGSRLDIIPQVLTWRGSFNLSFNYNKITKLFRSSILHDDLIPWDGGSPNYVEGKNAYTIWGVKYAGIYNLGTDGNPNMQPMIVGKDGAKYDLSRLPNVNAINYCYDEGTRVAPWILGFSSGINYKNFDLSFILTGKFGHVFQRTFYNYGGSIPNKYLKDVTSADPMKIMPLPQNDSESNYYFWNRFWPFFTYLTENASHIRMQEIACSYTFPKVFLAKYKISSLQIFAQANDVFSIYANNFDEDPEFKLGSNRMQTSFTIGLKLGF